MLILSDDYAKEDLIGHYDYSQGIVHIINSVDSDGAFIVGIYGQWGSGKTSFLQQIKKLLEEKNNQSEAVLTVWFNPWQFISEEHLIIPFFHTLIASLEGIANNAKDKKVKEQILVFLKKIAKIPKALLYGIESEIKLPLIFDLKFSGKDFIDQYDKTSEDNDENIAIASIIKEYESTYYNLLQVLNNAVSNLDFKIVVFIDDLDRCMPEDAIRLLEGLKVLLDLPNFVFVIALARKVIEQGVRLRYKHIFNNQNEYDTEGIEEEYLDKIIQFPFTLPTANAELVKENILNNYLKKIGNIEEYADLVYEVLGSNPRTLKRFINSISFTIHFANNKSDKKDELDQGLLLKIALVQYILPDLYKQVEKSPIYLVKLEEIILMAGNKRTEAEDDEIDGISITYNNIKKTGLPTIDKWLEGEYLKKLALILSYGSNKGKQTSIFSHKENVRKHIHFVSSVVDNEGIPNIKEVNTIKKQYISHNFLDRFVEIPSGEFIMGNENTSQRVVTLSYPLLIDKYPIDQITYFSVMNSNPSYFKGEDLPVENISWLLAIEFCNELSIQTGLEPVYNIQDQIISTDFEAKGFRLPTEAEWEYACNHSQKDFLLSEYAWYIKNSNNSTNGIGQKIPNDFGLFDMLGNVWEWCNDVYEQSLLDMPVTDPVINIDGNSRVLKGGSFLNFSKSITKAARVAEYQNVGKNNIGFRIVLQNKT